MKKTLQKHYLFISYWFFFLFINAYKLISFPKPLFDWDESLYVQNGIEMIAKRFFLVPLWQGRLWLDKPPLTPLLFGLVAKLSPFSVEVSTRLFTLFLTLIALLLIYKLYYKVTKNVRIATLTVIFTSFTPIFLQRAQVVSLDVFLLIGWLGYFIYLDQPILGGLFLLLSVQSKSLLGFYPLGVYGFYLSYLFLTKQLSIKELFEKVKIMVFQMLFLIIWYLAAFMVYGQEFWQAHIIESHFRRVTASIESHFGKRTFYIDILKEQFQWYFVPSLIGMLLMFQQFFKKKLAQQKLLLGLAFVPWFIFLNLTKTKIAWYLYPVIAQFAFLGSYSFSLIKPKQVQFLVFMVLAFSFLYTGIVKNSFINTFYSEEAEHIITAKAAKKICPNLAVLIPKQTRETYQTLADMNLVITTTSWWGEHPSMVYYFGKPLSFYYTSLQFKKEKNRFKCYILSKEDANISKNSDIISKHEFTNTILYETK